MPTIMEEYFDFNEASDLQDQYASDIADADETDAVNNYEALFWDKSAILPIDPPGIRKPGIDTTSVPIMPFSQTTQAYPMHRPQEPCDYCKQRGLDCFIAQKGTLLHGCTCCISLYRECSFTHRKAPGVWMSTFPAVNEDVQEIEGRLSGRRTMNSIVGAFNLAREDAQLRKNGGRFNREAVRTLRNWLATHTDHPYPTDKEKDDLKRLTGLKRSQISNWLANARRRGKVRPASEERSVHPGAIDIPQQPANNDAEVENLSPLERWKQSPPEHEPAAMTAIARAVSANPYPSGRNSSSSSLARSRQTSSNDDSTYSMFRAPSASSFGTAPSAQSSASSFQSVYSRGSLRSMDRKDKRRRRRMPATRMPGATQARGARIFQCTFCTDSFPAKYDWARHEKSLHLALERWTCAPHGAVEEFEGVPRCVFCYAANPNAEHLETHNYGTCEEKTVQEKTFYRKDHLRQHLKLLHGCAYNSRMDAWKSQTTEIKSVCGFCPAEFATWSQRTDHLAAHFRNGSDMSTWDRGWGFEPHVERLVENAMPPFMIAEERTTMDPFIATRPLSSGSPSSGPVTGGTNPQNSSSATGSTSNGFSPQIVEDSNCWKRTNFLLSQYIREEMLKGNKPSDEVLQLQARFICFGDDDPFNQTPADNKFWLDLVKKQNGLVNGEDFSMDEVPKQPNGQVVTRVEELPMNPPYVVPGGLRPSRASISKNTASRASYRRDRSAMAEAMAAMNVSSSSSAPPTAEVFPPQQRTQSNMAVPFPDTSFDAALIDPPLDFSNMDLSLLDDTLDLSKVDLSTYHCEDQQNMDTLMADDLFPTDGLGLDDLTFLQSSLDQPESSFPQRSTTDQSPTTATINRQTEIAKPQSSSQMFEQRKRYRDEMRNAQSMGTRDIGSSEWNMNQLSIYMDEFKR